MLKLLNNILRSIAYLIFRIPVDVILAGMIVGTCVLEVPLMIIYWVLGEKQVVSFFDKNTMFTGYAFPVVSTIRGLKKIWSK